MRLHYVYHGNNPASVKYAIGIELRNHLLRCLEDGFITPSLPNKLNERNLQCRFCNCHLFYALEHKLEKSINTEMDEIKTKRMPRLHVTGD